MKLTLDDLKPGSVLTAPNQGNNITPVDRQVRIRRVDDRDVFYSMDEEALVKRTGHERFLEIINQNRTDETQNASP